MRVVLQTYAHSHEEIEKVRKERSNTKKVDFPRDEVPGYSKLQRWAEAQFASERTTEFPHAVQTFLSAYANEGHDLPKVSFTHSAPEADPVMY